jgi:hypothetical protein
MLIPTSLDLRIVWKLALTAGILLGGSAVALGGPPLAFLIPFKHVEADPNKDYTLREEHGPWMIMAASFAGQGAEQQAHELVIELRKRYKLPAFTHRRQFDFTEPVKGLGFNRYGEPKQMKHMHASKFDEVAVLIGDFPTVDDPEAQKVLQKIKYARPACMEVNEQKSTTQRMGVLRELQRRISPDPDVKNKGPMRAAFVTSNPLLPEEYFAPRGLDPLVVKMNKDVEYGLLSCPGKFTVRVATFRGKDTMQVKEIERLETSTNSLWPWSKRDSDDSPLAIAADKANLLTLALRRRGVEAYEFHDLHESIVTIGAFDYVGTPRLDGKTEINPAIHAIMQTYGGQQQSLPGMGAVGLRPYTLEGITCDVQPMPVEVPRTSIATDYAQGNWLLR